MILAKKNSVIKQFMKEAEEDLNDIFRRDPNKPRIIHLSGSQGAGRGRFLLRQIPEVVLGRSKQKHLGESRSFGVFFRHLEQKRKRREGD